MPTKQIVLRRLSFCTIRHWKAVRLGSDQPTQLYNLVDDPGESSDLSTKQESIMESFKTLFDEHL